MRHFIAVCIALAFIAAACAPTPTPPPPTAAAQTLRDSTAVPAPTAAPPPPQPAAVPPQPDIPAVFDTLNFGLPAGNGYRPQKLAVDSARRRLYTLNEGLASARQGNTISLIDLNTGQVEKLIALNNWLPDQTFPPSPLGLMLDPHRPRLYALTGDRFGELNDISLTIIDTAAEAVIATLPGVEAAAPGPTRLYLANDTRLWAVNPDTLAELDTLPLEPRQYNLALWLDSAANRLFLARGPAWSVDIFKADALAPAGRTTGGELLQTTLDPANQRLLLIENDNGQVSLRAVDYTGAALAQPAPVPLAADLAYSALPPVISGDTLYVVNRDPNNYRDYPVQAFLLDDLTPQGEFRLPGWPYDLAADPAAGRLYAAYSDPDSVVLATNPTNGSTAPVFTTQTIADALAHPDSGQLYVQLNTGSLHVLTLNGYAPTHSLDTGYTPHNYYPHRNRLSLDAGRHRLYLSGSPVRVVDTQTWQVTPYPGSNGQLTPDPTTNRLYLTPPCQCRMELCNTIIVNADTLTGTQRLFPPAEPLVAPCVTATRLDTQNQLLYATIDNGVPGSNSGSYLMMFDVSGPPRPLHTAADISFGAVTFDPPHRRAFAPRYRIGSTFISRFEQQGQTISQTLELVGGQGQLTFDSTFNRLYAVFDSTLQVFDDSLALLAETTLPGPHTLLTFDAPAQRLYLANDRGQLLVVSTGGGQLTLPPPPPPDIAPAYWLRVAANGTRFRVMGSGLERSTNGGQTWQPLGRGLPARLIGDLAVSPSFDRDQTLWAGLWQYGQGGGLFRSTDGGDTWLPATRGLTDLGIQYLAVSPTFERDRTIFAGTAVRGLFRSTNGGDNWEWLAPSYAPENYNQAISALAVSPTFADDGLVLIGHNTLLRSANGGQSWANTGLPPGRVAFSPNFAADGLILSDGRRRSTDRGQSWQPAAAGLEFARQTQAILFSPNFAADSIVYIVLTPEYPLPRRLQRSTDAGRTWQSLQGGLPADFALNFAAILPNGNLYLADGAGQALTRSPQQLSWGSRPVDMAAVEWQALAAGPNGALFAANSAAGVFRSTNGGRTWADADFPARANDVNPARLALANDGTLFAAVGNIVERSADGGQSWTYLDGLPLSFNAASLEVSPKFGEDGLVLAGGNYRQRQLWRSANRGQSWHMAYDGEIEGGSDISQIAFDPQFAQTGRVYAWQDEVGLLVSEDRGQTWQTVAGEQTPYGVQALAAAPNGRLFLGALDGHVLVSTDQGQNWDDWRDRIPGKRVWSSSLAFMDDEVMILGTDVGIFRSADGGQTWTEAGAGLPTDPNLGGPQAVRVVRASAGRVYAALTAGGVYVSDDRGQSWRNTQSAPPQATATALPAPLPTPTPHTAPADCPAAPAFFADIWAARLAQLGCPGPGQRVTAAVQPFEGGLMVWRSDIAAIYALPAGQPYHQFADTWDESQPAYGCPEFGPAQTPPTPQRGFGKVWCGQPEMRQQLGNATGPETPLEAVFQEFKKGLVMDLPGTGLFVLENRQYGWQKTE